MIDHYNIDRNAAPGSIPHRRNRDTPAFGYIVRHWDNSADLIHCSERFKFQPGHEQAKVEREWCLGEHPDEPTAKAALSTGDVHDSTMDLYTEARKRFAGAFAKVTGEYAKVSGKRRKRRNPYAGQLNVQRFLAGDAKPFTQRSRRTQSPKIRIAFRNNGNGHVDSEQMARCAANAAAVAQLLFDKGFAVDVSALIGTKINGVFDCDIVRLHTAGHRLDAKRLLSIGHPGMHRVWARDIRAQNHRKTDTGFGCSVNPPHDLIEENFDIFLNIDGEQSDVIHQVEGLLGKIKEGKLNA